MEMVNVLEGQLSIVYQDLGGIYPYLDDKNERAQLAEAIVVSVIGGRLGGEDRIVIQEAIQRALWVWRWARRKLGR